MGKNPLSGRTPIRGKAGFHGRSRTPIHGIWSNMINRCTNPNCERYPHYGGRGITVCERWLKDFRNFLADMGERPSPDHSIDRIDNDGNYEPANCRWATKAEQQLNKQRSHKVTAFGETKNVYEWARDARYLVSGNLLQERISVHGYDPETAMTAEPYTVRRYPAKPSGCSSRFRGVSLHETGKWMAMFKSKGQRFYLGIHESEESAARAYDAKATEVLGESARLNFQKGVGV